jgi:Xaa-Pro dipeptidase
VAEYTQRLDAIQGQLGRKHADGMLVMGAANLFYLTGYETIGLTNFAMALVPIHGEPRLLVRELESTIARRLTWLSTEPVIYRDGEDPMTKIRDLIDGPRRTRAIVIDTASTALSVVSHRHLIELFPEVNFIEGSGIVESARCVKSAAELNHLRQASLYTRAGMEAAVGAVHDGAYDNEVGAAAASAMYRAGSEFFASGPTVTTGWRSGIPHTTFQRNRLGRGDVALIEIGGVHHRYSCPLMRSVVISPATDVCLRMHAACAEGLSAALRSMRPGVTSDFVHAACQRAITAAGFEENFRKRLGYSVGVGFPPGWGEGSFLELAPGDQTILRPGMVFHLPPALRVDSVLGVGCSETVVVTDSGAEVIGDYPRTLFHV